MTPIIVGIFWTILLFGLIIWNIYDHIIRLDKQNKEQQKQIDELKEYINIIISNVVDKRNKVKKIVENIIDNQ